MSVDLSTIIDRGDRSSSLTELRRDIAIDDTSLPVLSTAPFADSGVLRVGSEAVEYTSKTDVSFEGCTRGTRTDQGFTPAQEHPGGTHVWSL
ncbi:MAG: hypothetical protein JSS40_08370, partial [Proteobacteria bacterium]|nr:hypothetical protein [Pseudomonadota bacterium]